MRSPVGGERWAMTTNPPLASPVQSVAPTLEPTSERAVALRLRMGETRWPREVAAAHRRLDVLREVKRLHGDGFGKWRACLRNVAPGLHWSTFCHWRRLVGTVEGPDWERLLDARIP